jgi:hypothetical protein
MLQNGLVKLLNFRLVFYLNVAITEADELTKRNLNPENENHQLGFLV